MTAPGAFHREAREGGAPMFATVTTDPGDFRIELAVVDVDGTRLVRVIGPAGARTLAELLNAAAALAEQLELR